MSGRVYQEGVSNPHPGCTNRLNSLNASVEMMYRRYYNRPNLNIAVSSPQERVCGDRLQCCLAAAAASSTDV